MGCNLVCHYACAHIVLVGQCQVFLRSYVAEHGCAVPSYHGCTDGRCDVVVGRSNVGYERAECVEGCTVALLYLALHVLLYLVHWHVSRTLDECLYALSPSTFYKLAHSVEFGKLCCVVGVVGRTGAQSVAQRNGNVILGADVADVVEVGIEETLLLMHLAPLRDDAAATAHDARQTCVGEVDVLQTDAAMDGEVVYSLLALLD